MLVDGVPHRTVDWQDGHVVLIDQPLLPHAFRLWRIVIDDLHAKEDR